MPDSVDIRVLWRHANNRFAVADSGLEEGKPLSVAQSLQAV